jgi:osmotically-inducible protein OsmY
MSFTRILSALVIAGFIAGPLVACAGTSSKESTGEYVDSSVLSNKVRAKLADDKDLNMFQIDVTTFKDEVQLSGFVNNAAAKARATQVVASVEGVKMVHNNLVVKP